MSFLSKIKIPHLAVRGIQVFFSLMVLILSAHVANWYNTATLISSPPHINVLFGAAVFSLLSVALLELLPKFVPFFSNPYLQLAIECINVPFWLGSGIAITVLLSRMAFCWGSVCAAAQADAVFAYVMFGAWLGTLVPLAIRMVKGDGARKVSRLPTGDGAAAGAAPLAPAMTWGSTASLALEKERAQGKGKGKDDGFEDV